MDPRPRQPAPGPPPGADHDSTDELPALDPAAFEAAARERLETSDTWIMPRPAPRAAPALAGEPAQSAESATAGDDPLQTAADNLREALALLASRGEQLAQVESFLEKARGEAAAAERRATQLADELKEARATAAERETRLGAELAAARGEVERSHAEAAGREARLGEELAQARAAAGQQASRLAEDLAKAHAESEERLRAVREAAASTQRSRDLQNAKAISARDRAHVAMQTHIDELRARAAGYFEALQSAEHRRALLAGLLTELGEEAAAREARHARLARELAGHERRGAELEAQLKQSLARTATLEGGAGNFAAALAARDRELARLQGEQASLTAM
ncbi:MAG TPA: hypothetical protein VFK87_00930, partial [Steroidobacteraceae bacterium]|nr:hypothetical protein [Steroidobacteraceae bacterium]